MCASLKSSAKGTLGYSKERVTDIVSVMAGTVRHLSSGRRSADTEKASERLPCVGGGGGGDVGPISVMEGGLEDRLVGLEGGGESTSTSTSSSGDEHGEHRSSSLPHRDTSS